MKHNKSVWMITTLLIATPSNMYFLIFCFSSFCWVFALLYYFFWYYLKVKTVWKQKVFQNYAISHCFSEFPENWTIFRLFEKTISQSCFSNVAPVDRNQYLIWYCISKFSFVINAIICQKLTIYGESWASFCTKYHSPVLMPKPIGTSIVDIV